VIEAVREAYRDDSGNSKVGNVRIKPGKRAEVTAKKNARLQGVRPQKMASPDVGPDLPEVEVMTRAYTTSKTT
jgi:hypothetical protein